MANRLQAQEQTQETISKLFQIKGKLLVSKRKEGRGQTEEILRSYNREDRVDRVWKGERIKDDSFLIFSLGSTYNSYDELGICVLV